MPNTGQGKGWFKRKHFLAIGEAYRKLALAAPVDDDSYFVGLSDSANALADIFEKDNKEFRREAFINDCLAL